MKKLLSISIFAISTLAMAQVPVVKVHEPVKTPVDQKSIDLRLKTATTTNPVADVAGPDWFQLSEAVRSYQGGGTANYSYLTLFPDTNAYISYVGSGGVGSSVTKNYINSAGIIFDPRGTVWGSIGPFKTSRWNAYTVDSMRFQFFYRRFNSNANAKDTIVVSVFDNTSISRGFTTIYAGAVDYTPVNLTAKGTNVKTTFIELTPNDTVGGGQVMTIPIPGGSKTINGNNSGGNYFGATISFKPAYKGYQHGAPFDTVAFYNTGAVFNNTKVCNMFRLLDYFDPGKYVEDLTVPAINGFRIYNHGIQAEDEARYKISVNGNVVDYFYPSMYTGSNGFPAIDFRVSTQTLATSNIENGSVGTAFPNPAKGGSDLNIPFQLSTAGTVQVNLVNMQGQVVRTTSATFSAGKNVVTFNTNGLADGIYTYTIIAPDFSGSGKAVVR